MDLPGRYGFTVRSELVPEEYLTSDNELESTEISVVDEEIRVLLVAGDPTWEYQLLQRLFQRESTITLSCWLQTMDLERAQEGNLSISELPTTFEDIAQYHVIILIDPNPREFTREWVNAVKRFCRQKAGGLLYMAGPKYNEHVRHTKSSTKVSRSIARSIWRFGID